MRLNQNDFYECTLCHLQIVIPYPGVQAVILNKRGKGLFRSAESFADENIREEIFTKQSSERFPFGDMELLQSNYTFN